MNHIPSYCPVCDCVMIETPGGAACPRCDVPAVSFSQPVDDFPPLSHSQPPQDAQSLNAGQPDAPGLFASYADVAHQAEEGWGIWMGLLVWAASIILLLALQLVALLGYGILFDRGMLTEAMAGRLTASAVIVSLVSAFVAQILTLALAWVVVTNVGKRPFLKTLKWEWHPNFNWLHAIGLTIVMLAVGALCSKVLPHKDTELDVILKMGLVVRVVVAILATMGAPIVEEIVYRGVLYQALERAQGKILAVAIVTLLFWGVHVPQYSKSVAVLVSVFVLSLALTLVRARTGKLLPSVATHFLFNGIQAVGIVFAGPGKAASEPVRTSVITLLQWCGLA